MQVLPSTAAASPIKIKSITALENNIHAGVRMLNFIRDVYLKDEPMDKVNKTLITLASYNAGPARLSQCGQLAEKMGLNPNVWFGNVEFAVAKGVGRETVQYVSNIY
jgi:membrane-bound lytic murein transglycosylase MltF